MHQNSSFRWPPLYDLTPSHVLHVVCERNHQKYRCDLLTSHMLTQYAYALRWCTLCPLKHKDCKAIFRDSPDLSWCIYTLFQSLFHVNKRNPEYAWCMRCLMRCLSPSLCNKHFNKKKYKKKITTLNLGACPKFSPWWAKLENIIG